MCGNGLFYEFPYRRLSNKYNIPLAPIVDIRLKSRNNILGIVINEFGLIDSGADVTLVPMAMITRLRLEPIKNIQQFLTPISLSQQVLAKDAYSLWLSFGDDNYFRITVWGLEIRQRLIIVGRDLLNIGFKINLDGKNLMTTIWYGFDN